MDDVEWLPTPLTASRVRVRRPVHGDEAALVALFTDEEVRQFVGGPLGEDDARRRAAQLVADSAWGDLVVEARTDRAVIGSGDLRRKRGPWEISYQFDRAHWGLGLASETLEFLVAWFFAATNEDLLIAVTQDGNQRSARVLERGGALLTDTFQQYGAVQRRYEFRRESLSSSADV
ncbi:GNAT family N-acetyltransferase [Cryptosporangium sp. NPDC048952]|uniref:GNAT family N-acetyltransferase n=1 Tax=Cryptosporangium sp. NPDC048952 TaxID=3363961 RepID=UPI003712453C